MRSSLVRAGLLAGGEGNGFVAMVAGGGGWRREQMGRRNAVVPGGCACLCLRKDGFQYLCQADGAERASGGKVVAGCRHGTTIDDVWMVVDSKQLDWEGALVGRAS